MRKNILFILTVSFMVGLASCSVPTMNDDLMTVYRSPEFDNVQDANIWVNKYVEYAHDSDNPPDGDLTPHENWQTPEETLYLGTGDCEDFASLLLWIVEEQGLGEGYLLSIEYEKNGRMAYHMTTIISDSYYEYGIKYSSYPYKYKVVNTYSLDEYMKISIVRNVNL